jgi:hypothetical protein
MPFLLERGSSIMHQGSQLVAIPSIALSVRQPWAWAIIHAGKDIENRSWQAVDRGSMRRGRVAIHAAKGMTQEEYRSAAEFMASIGIVCPPPADLKRGGVIGAVEIIDIVSTSPSPWFFGPRGLVLRNAQPCAFVPAVGQLGYFSWTPADPAIEPEPALWMLPKPRELNDDSVAKQLTMLV